MPPRPRRTDPLDDVAPAPRRKRGAAGGSAAHAPFQTIFDGLKEGFRAAASSAAGAAAGAAIRGEAGAYAELVKGPLATWLRHFATNAVPRMRAILARGAPCAIEAYDPAGHQTACPDPAAFVCAVCQRPCCPAHAFLAWTGDAICPGCVQAAQRASQPPRWGQPPPWANHRGGGDPAGNANGTNGHGPHSPPPDPRGAQRQRVEAAFATLGLQYGAPWPLVEAKWKELVREGHPDRFPEAQRAAQEDRIKQVNAAFQFLKSLHDQQTQPGAA